VQAAPPALATVVTSTALAESAVASGTTLTLVKGVLRIMAWTKAKIMVAVGAGVMLAAGTATMLVEHHLQGAGGHRPNSSFHAKGKVQFQFFQDNTNTVLARGARTFEVDVEGQRWAITARAVPDDGHPDEMTCDGLYTYATITGLATSRNPPSFPNISAQIKKDAVPFSSAGHAVECVWLSFASAGYLNSEKKGLFSPAWLEVNRTESALLGDRFHTEVVRLQNQPRLPKSIDCRANGFIWGASGLDKHALAPPFNAGYPCFTFRVNSVTNVAGMRIPTASALDVFYPHPGGTNAEDVVLGLHVELTAEQVEPATKRAEWQPPLGTRTQIKDFRFVKRSSDSRPVTYDVDGDRWPRESAPIVIAARQHQGRSAWWRKLFWLWNCWSSGVEARPV
jgi:hypothetical protein